MKLVRSDGTATEATMAQAIYTCAAHAMDLDLAPARRVVDSFTKRLFDCTVDDLTVEQQHAVALHIKAGDVKAHAGELIAQGWTARAERNDSTMAGKRDGDTKKPLYQQTDEELDRNFRYEKLKLESGPQVIDAQLADATAALDEIDSITSRVSNTPNLHEERSARTNGRKPTGKAGRLSRGPLGEIDGTAPGTAADAPIEARLPFEELTIAVKSIVPNAFNPRRVFEESKLRELGESIKADGQDTPIWVRPQPGMEQHHTPIYELIAGERRWRAHQLVGLKTIRARIYHVDDRRTAELCFRENHDREDLNPVEEAMSIDMMIRIGGHTQEQMAARLGVEQGTIANKLGVLKLPQDWQARIISGEITPTHARCLPKWADYPNVLAEIDDRLRKRLEYNKYFPNSEEFTDIVMSSALHVGRAITGDYSITTENGGHRHGKVLFKVTPELREQLRVETVKDYNGSRPFAFNVELWEQLQAAAKRDEKKKQQKKLDKAGKAGAKKASPRNDREKEEARWKAQTEQRERDEAARLWLGRWLKSLMLERIDVMSAAHIRILAMTIADPCEQDVFARAVQSAGGHVIFTRDGVFKDMDRLASLCTIDPSKLEAFERRGVQMWMDSDSRWINEGALKAIAQAAAMVGIDPAKEFKVSMDCLELFTLDELKEIGTEWGVHKSQLNRTDRKEQMNLLLHSHSDKAKFPSRLLKLLPKAAAEKPAKKKKGGK